MVVAKQVQVRSEGVLYITGTIASAHYGINSTRSDVRPFSSLKDAKDTKGAIIHNTSDSNVSRGAVDKSCRKRVCLVQYSAVLEYFLFRLTTSIIQPGRTNTLHYSIQYLELNNTS